MKVSVSLPAADLESLDRFVEHEGLPSRSAGIQRAIRLLNSAELTRDYAVAFDNWHESGDGDAWEAVVADGLHAPR